MEANSLIHPDLGNGLTNHEPMVTSALKELGATRAHIARYQALMAQKTQPVTEPGVAIQSDEEFKTWLGQRKNYAGLFEYLEQQQQSIGSRRLINTYLPLLADGITGGAFHPVIRLGHAVHDFNDTEIVQAMAYWAWAYQALPYPETDEARDGDAAKILQQLLDGVTWPTERIGRPTITEEFEEVVRMPMYQTFRFHLNDEALSFDALNELAIQALWMHDDFTLLHGVTSLQAVGRISKWLDNPRLLLEPMWKGYVIAWLSKGVRWTPIEQPESEPALSIEQIKTIAAHGTRDHTVKLVAACLENYRMTQNVIYLHVAEREIRNDAQLSVML